MRIPVVLIIVAIWVFALVNDSGWGMLFHTGERMSWLIVFCSIYLLWIRRRTFIPKLTVSMIVCLLLFFIIIPNFLSNEWDGAIYLISFLTIFCFSNINISAKELTVSSIAIGILGLGLITVYQKTEILSGWNDNSIAMLTLFSYIYFTIFFNSAKGNYIRFLCIIISLVYYVLILETESRGAALFMSLSILLMLTRKYALCVLTNPKMRFLTIHFPLIIAAITVWVSLQSWFPELDRLYQIEHTKSIFNGRDVIWGNTFNQIIRYPFGVGEFNVNHHNSAVACIGVFGILGYIVWCKFFLKQLSKMSDYLCDYMVYACMCAFIVIYIQQSIELGFIRPCPNMIPYMILGLGLGRVRWYEDHHKVYG